MEIKNNNRIPFIRIVILFISGVLIGGGAILPGISGGVLAVIFGIYKPLMELLAHPKQKFPKLWRMLLPVAVGWLVGFFLFAKVIDWIFGANETLGTWLFIGLIAGEIPQLLKEAGDQGRSKGSYIAMIVAFVVTLGILILLQSGLLPQVELNTFWIIIAGVLWGLSLIVPGLSSSSSLMALGLYVPLMSQIGNSVSSIIERGVFDLVSLRVLGLWLIGLVVSILLLARVVNHFFDSHYSKMYHVVVGVTVASTVAMIVLGTETKAGVRIIPWKFESVGMFFLSLLCCAIGVGIALWMSKMDPGDSVKNEIPEEPEQVG